MKYEDMITVANVRGTPREADIRLYCGRGEAPRGMVKAGLGNPYTVHQWGRGTAIAKFETRLYQLPNESRERRVIRRIATRLMEGKTVQLFCWCHPAACHCDVIRREVLKEIKFRQLI